MNSLQKIFQYQGTQVRTVIQDGEPWFVAKDVAEILEYANPSKMYARLDEDEKTTIPFREDGSNYQTNIVIINESGLYEAVLGSEKPEAKDFKKWVKTEVLPSIRKTGTYIAPQIDSKMLFQIAAQLEEKEKQIMLLGTENKLLSQENLTWTNRKLIEALVKKLGGTIGYETAWREFKKELLYKHSINLNARLTAKINATGKKNYKKLDMIHDEELSACISTAVALCKASKVEIASILDKFSQTA